MNKNFKLILGVVLGIAIGAVSMSLTNFSDNSAADLNTADGQLAWAKCDLIIEDYQNNPFSAQNEPRLYITNSTGTKELLKSWWLSKSDIDRLVSDTQAKLNTMQGAPAISGFRFYPALQTKNEAGAAVPAHHSLVLVGTYAVGSGHSNVRIESPQEYVLPCPISCDLSTDATLGN